MRKNSRFFVIIFKTRKNVKKKEPKMGQDLGGLTHFWLGIDQDSVQRQWDRAKPRAPLLLDGF